MTEGQVVTETVLIKHCMSCIVLRHEITSVQWTVRICILGFFFFLAISGQLRSSMLACSHFFPLPLQLCRVLVLNGMVQDGGWSPNHL